MDKQCSKGGRGGGDKGRGGGTVLAEAALTEQTLNLPAPWPVDQVNNVVLGNDMVACFLSRQSGTDLQR